VVVTHIVRGADLLARSAGEAVLKALLCPPRA